MKQLEELLGILQTHCLTAQLVFYKVFHRISSDDTEVELCLLIVLFQTRKRFSTDSHSHVVFYVCLRLRKLKEATAHPDQVSTAISPPLSGKSDQTGRLLFMAHGNIHVYPYTWKQRHNF